jgi:hypothetical protein
LSLVIAKACLKQCSVIAKVYLKQSSVIAKVCLKQSSILLGTENAPKSGIDISINGLVYFNGLNAGCNELILL